MGLNNAKCNDDQAIKGHPFAIDSLFMKSAPKVSDIFSGNVVKCQELNVDSNASIKMGAESELQFRQACDILAKSSDYTLDHNDQTETTVQVKRQETVQFNYGSPNVFDHDESGHVGKDVLKRAASSVVKIEPGAPPPLKLEPGAQLHIRQPFKILVDIWGVLTSHTFRNDLFAYIDEHLKEYILAHFDEVDIKEFVSELAKRTVEDLAKGIWPTIPLILLPEENQDKEIVAASVENNLNFRRASKDKSLTKGLEVIYCQIWNHGYRNKSLRPPLFSDVLPCFRKWNSEPLFIKLFTFASGPSEIQKLFLQASASADGDISNYVTYSFDTRHSFKYDSVKYLQVVNSLGEREPKNLFYLTDSPRKGREARKAGLTVFIIRRPGNRQYRSELLEQFTVIDSLEQFDFFEFH